MKLIDILKEIDIRLPNTLSAEDKIGFLNHAIRDIYKYCGETFTYKAEADKEVKLPKHITYGLIKSVFVNDEQYFDAKKTRGGKSKFTVNDENNLVLDPAAHGVLSVKYTAYNLFRPLSDVLSDDSIGDKTKFYEEQTGGIDDQFSELLVLGALYRTAAAEEDITQSNNFKGQYDELKRQAMGQRFKKGFYPITKIVR